MPCCCTRYGEEEGVDAQTVKDTDLLWLHRVIRICDKYVTKTGTVCIMSWNKERHDNNKTTKQGCPMVFLISVAHLHARSFFAGSSIHVPRARI